MAVPSDREGLVWVSVDGTVQMWYVTFTPGNLHEKRLKEMLFTREHHGRHGRRTCEASIVMHALLE